MGPFMLAADIAARLLAWYDSHRRDLPWRAPPGAAPDPYHVWLSEVMLQQTTVAAVRGYFYRFLQCWPSVAELAAADPDAVLNAWAGLGYYARARNLHKCAQTIVSEHAGRFPDTEAGLKALPGIGDYTAAAIAAIAFDRPATAVDGNIERVIARLFHVETPLPAAKPKIKSLAQELTPASRPGDYVQAVMDLGATVCTPARPKCLLCPLRPDCRAHAAGDMERLPVKAPKKPKPTRYGTVFRLAAEQQMLVRRRPPKGLLGGMLELPGTPWENQPQDLQSALAHAPVETSWRAVPGIVRHSFTHFHLELRLVAAVLARRPGGAAGLWVPEQDLSGLPTVMRKAALHALSADRTAA